MRTLKMAGVDKEMSVLGLGTMIFAPSKKDLSFEIIDNYTSNGGNYFDTAEIYGDPEERGYSEQLLGMWFEETGKREEIVLCSKGLIAGYCKPIHPNGLECTPEYISPAISGSLERLRTSYLDCWSFHRDNPEVPAGEFVDALAKEIDAGRIKSYGFSNWSVTRIQEAIDYARKNNLPTPSASSPHFSLAVAKEPFWPNTVVVSEEDKKWYEEQNLPLVAWSSLARGFIAIGRPDFLENEDLVRVYYNDNNFERLNRAEEIGKSKGLNKIEVALAYVLSQSFPTIALVGAANKTEMLSCVKAANTVLTPEEVSYLDLKS